MKEYEPKLTKDLYGEIVNDTMNKHNLTPGKLRDCCAGLVESIDEDSNPKNLADFLEVCGIMADHGLSGKDMHDGIRLILSTIDIPGCQDPLIIPSIDWRDFGAPFLNLKTPWKKSRYWQYATSNPTHNVKKNDNALLLIVEGMHRCDCFAWKDRRNCIGLRVLLGVIDSYPALNDFDI